MSGKWCGEWGWGVPPRGDEAHIVRSRVTKYGIVCVLRCNGRQWRRAGLGKRVVDEPLCPVCARKGPHMRPQVDEPEKSLSCPHGRPS